MSKPKPAPKAEAIEQVPNPNFDLDGYINNYTGYTKIRRLMYIAQRCPDVSLRAYRMAIDLLKSGLNVPLFTECVSQAREQLGSALDDKWGMDPKWVDTTHRAGQERLNRYEAAVTEAKRIGDSDPTLLAIWEVADHLIAIGDFQKAQAKLLEGKSFDSGDPVKGIKTCMKIIESSINQGSMNHVKNQVGRAQTFRELKAYPLWQAQLAVCSGLQNLKTKNFSQAAYNFLGTGIEIDGKYPEIITSRDVAVYAVVCALACFSRRDLQEKVVNSESFKVFLDMVPDWKQVIVDFQNSNYARCFKTLNKLKPDLKLDMHLGPHVDELIAKIMEKGLVQYFKPFTSVKIPKMAQAFEMPVPELEKALITLISDNHLQGRIDSHNKVLHAKHADQRSATFQQVLSLGEVYSRECKALMMRMALAEHNFVVRSPPKKDEAEMDP